nr:non-ribosomal peptide synthetase/type I polyketide synthase [Pedobacter frigoris]
MNNSHLTAVQMGDQYLSYQQLNERANALAATIGHAAPKSEIIGISTTRSIDTIVCLLAILKAGKAYLPLDPAMPYARLKDIIEDAGLDICVAPLLDKKIFEDLINKVIVPNENVSIRESEIISEKQKLAYVIYTSGSTGKPKGVGIDHPAVINLIQWHEEISPYLEQGFRTLQFSPLSFDVSVMEIFCTICSGGTLVLVDEETRLDPLKLLDYIEKYEINRLSLPFVALQYLTEVADIEKRHPSSLQEVITAGEQLKISPQISRFFQALPGCVFYNMYGPTETTVFATALRLEGKPESWPLLPSIGKPVANSSIFVLDEEMKQVPIGKEGELCITGINVANGYLNNSELTAEKFIDWIDEDGNIVHLYRSGDLCRILSDNNIEFLGRKDTQVKIRGNRVELGEIEAHLNQIEGIQQCVVVASEDPQGQKRLIAYMQSSGIKKDFSFLRINLGDQLPDYMIPALFIWVDSFEKTSSGKIDRKALPLPDLQRPELSIPYSAPISATEIRIAALWAELLQLNRIGRNDNFFEVGGNSLLAVKSVTELKKRYEEVLPITKLYQYPTVSGIGDYLENKETISRFVPLKIGRSEKKKDVAVIGMSLRFPGANSIEELWEILAKGKETVSFFTDAELDASIAQELKDATHYVKARGVIENAGDFDANFFGIPPNVAELMDPQQRIFLELAWEALENSGHIPEKYSGKIGVFAGSGNNTYYTKNVLSNPELVSNVGDFLVSTLNEKDYIATRAAYELNLNGPAVSVHAACSTSLLAIVQAAESIRNGQCDVALAGGSSVHTPVNSGHLYQQGTMLSGDGHCRSFDAKADGTIFSDGAGIVVLKGLEEAQRDGDVIYAVLKGVGLNNDGHAKASFTAPSALGQAGAIAMAINDAGIEPGSISYVEAHGTGTILGDPIEIEGLKLAFGKQESKQFCAIGSIKSNMGHLVAAAGVAGFIKTVLSLHHQQLPATLFYDKPNPNIDFENSPFFVNDKLKHWNTENKRIAGVSSFGVGGTNVHVILEEYLPEPKETSSSRSLQLVSWSAKTPASAVHYAERILEYVQKNPDVELADIAWNLHTRRAGFKERNFIVAANRDELLQQLSDFRRNSESSLSLKNKANTLVFMFPGQGSQYANMGLELYQNERVFCEAVDECLSILNGPSYEQLISGDPRFTQSAMFVTSYAVSKLWLSWGITPTMFVGHSIGEFVAAHFAGIFSLSDVLRLITERIKLVGELPGGSMLSVRMESEQLKKILPEKLSVAVINTDKLCVVAGETTEVDKFSAVLKQHGVPAIVLNTSHAFHSEMMEPIVAKFEAVLRTVKFNKPSLPIISTVTGDYLTDEEATDPRYWAQHIRKTVRFDRAINTLSVKGDCLLLEAGPGHALTTFAKQQTQGKNLSAIIRGITHSVEQNEYRSFLKSAGQLWLNGVDIDWTSFYETEGRRLRLPSYAFDHKRYWVKPNQQIIINTPDTVTVSIPQNAKIAGGLLEKQLKAIFEDASGIEMKDVAGDISFAELGFDSLLLTQIATNINKIFKVHITFRRLFETLNSIDRLSAFLSENFSPQSLSSAVTVEPVLPVLDEEEMSLVNKPFGAAARIEKQSKGLIDSQQSFLSKLIIDYNKRTSGSKNKTQESRSYMADPRVVSGFRPMTKELVYPVIVKHSKGSRLWDVDGNEYIDALNGFGSNMFGYQPEFIKDALHQQIERGYEIGPQHELAGEVAKLLCEFTGFDRAGLCNTGSEAVLGAMRIARSVTGKQLIVAFSGSYHGIIDEVIVRGTKNLKSIPAASGILPGAVQNMLILDYGTDESLKIIGERAHEIAAVLVEPVQSRRPDFQPVEFLKELRVITGRNQIALVFDEVITGFRMHPGGAQALFGIKADLATYGKVIGGGLSIGVIAGIKAYMDALDGGYWKYGDASMPEVGVTYFAGTFVRHPLALASAKASLLHMKQAGNTLQENLTRITQQFILDMDAVCKREKLPLTVVGFGSLWRLRFTEDVPYSELLFTLMRLKGIHILDGFPCFMTTAHTDADISAIVKAFEESIEEMIKAGFLYTSGDSKIVEATNREDILTVPATESQLEIWTACLIGGSQASCAYNDSASIELSGAFNQEAMRKALQIISDRHESLRAVFSAEGQQMIVRKELPVNISVHDLSAKKENLKEEFIAKDNYESATMELDLANGPLFKATIFKLSHTRYIVKLLLHHIICDGWSIGILMQEISKIYSSLVKREPLQLPPAQLFSEYAEEEHRKLNVENEKYWLEQFEGGHNPLDIPTDKSRPVQRTYKSKRADFDLDADLVKEIKQVARKAGSSFVTTMLGAFELFLQQLTGQEEIIIGLPVAGQSATGKYGLVGHCVNLLPLRSFPDVNKSFSSYLKQRTTEILDAYDHQGYTFGTLLKKLNLRRDPSRLALIPVIFNIDIGMDEGVEFEGLTHRYISNPREYETFEIFLNITNNGDALILEWSYNTALFDSASIEKMMQRYEYLLRQLVIAPDTPIRNSFSKIDDEQIDQLKKWNNTACFYPEDQSLPQLISDVVAMYPDHSALTFKDVSFTYSELNAKANQLAALLIENGLKKGDKIAVSLDRSAELVVGILAAIKAGGVYVPLDPKFPANRINYMLEDSGAVFLLTSSSGKIENKAGIREIVLNETLHKLDGYPSTNPEVIITGTDLLYVLYTSGSTGQPKGVMVAHHNMVNFLYSMKKRPGLMAADKLLAVTTISFDIAGLELFLPLISGAEIVLADDESIKDGRALLDIIKNEAITVMQATPYTWRMLLEAGWGEEKIKAICGGEALPLDLAKNILKRASSLWNVYGPTETTVWSTVTEVKAEDNYVSIGRPIDNTTIYLLDQFGNPVATETAGEIYVGGAGVTKGYLNQAALTADKFIDDPFSEIKDAKMYRTGDLARLNEEGELIYISRIDQQVKIRGYRIETAEIEHFLCQEKEIKQAVVMPLADHRNINRLIAFVVLNYGFERGNNEVAKDWRNTLKTSLPEYMVPDDFVILTEMPLTPNGKIDRKQLSNQANVIPESRNYQHMAPRTDVEQMVAEIWKKSLGIENIGIHDNFFELGGHSLIAVEVMSKIEKETGKRLPLAVLFENSTVERLALMLNMDGKSITWDSLVPIKTSGTKIPIYIVHGAGLNVLLFNTLAMHMDEGQPVYGLQAKGLNGVDEPLERIEDIAAHYISAILAQNPNGPYALAGYSFGGIIAFEMAKQLEAQNKEVRMLAMFDTYAYRTPHYDPFITKYINKGLYFGRKMWYSLTFQEGIQKTIAHRSQAVKRALTRVYWKLKYGKQQVQEGFFGYANEIDEKNDIASRLYQITPYNIAIEVFSAQERSFYVDDFEYMGWKPYALKGVNIHKVPGEHNTIFKAPNDRIFAEVLQECLNKINND